jgi:hypothetical protein
MAVRVPQQVRRAQQSCTVLLPQPESNHTPRAGRGVDVFLSWRIGFSQRVGECVFTFRRFRRLLSSIRMVRLPLGILGRELPRIPTHFRRSRRVRHWQGACCSDHHKFRFAI